MKSSVKDESLIEKRREQMIRGAVKLFKEKGFHRATTREIAKAAGFSIGTLYEYIRTKEDVLYLVCDSIYNEVHDRLSALPTQEGTVDGLRVAINQYYHLIDDMSDEFLVMYQESKSLPKDALAIRSEKRNGNGRFVRKSSAMHVQSRGNCAFQQEEVGIAAHHIVVQGQMWAFRRWALHKSYTIEDYIHVQTDQLFKGLIRVPDTHTIHEPRIV